MTAGNATNAAAAAAAVILRVPLLVLLISGSSRLNGLVGRLMVQKRIRTRHPVWIGGDMHTTNPECRRRRISRQ
jgi:hypothetical protein